MFTFVLGNGMILREKKDSVLCLINSKFLMPLEFPEAVWGWSGVSGWARRGVGVSLEACDAISMTHKKSGNVQDIAAALKKNASKDV